MTSYPFEQVPTVAWTGGSTPRSPSSTSMVEHKVRKVLFRAAVAQWLAFWGDYPDHDTLRVLYRRARYDAHASVRIH